MAIDIGNTSTAFGYFKNGRLVYTKRLLTRHLELKATGFLKRHFPLKQIEAVVIASVVPNKSVYLRREIPRKLKKETWVIGRDIQVPVKNKYKNPQQVGTDRLVNALAFFEKYKRDGIIVDFGTAITFDVVSKQGEYLGGVIAPGIETSIEALYQKTALLPKIKLTHPRNRIGKDTVESIRIGCSHGIGGLCDRIIDQIRLCFTSKPLVLATGGYARFMSRYSHKIDAIDSHLTLRGIASTYYLNS